MIQPNAPALPTILLVDDEPAIREILVMVLEEIAVVTAVSNAEAAAIKLNQSPYSLLLTDVQMPGDMNGLDLAWLAHSRWPRMPILVISGYQDPNSLPLPPGTKFLAKPWVLEDFEALVKRSLGGV